MPQTKAHDFTKSGDINALDEYLNNNPNSKKQYEFNKKIIDFKFIPTKYFNNVIKLFLTIKLIK